MNLYHEPFINAFLRNVQYFIIRLKDHLLDQFLIVFKNNYFDM